MLQELPDPEHLLKPRDGDPIIYVPASTWTCVYCDVDAGEGAATSVSWIGPGTDGPDGRCEICGQKYSLARVGESVPTPEEQKWP